MLPERTAKTMGDAIALSSPNGRMSKRAKKAAVERIRVELFGETGMTREDCCGTIRQPTEKERLESQARRLRDLAGRGMCVKKFNKEADRLEKEARKWHEDESDSTS